MPKLTIVPLLVTPKGVSKPVRASQNVYAAFKEVSEFYYQQLGVTFDVGAVKSYVYPMTWAEVEARWSGDGQEFWKDIVARIPLDMCAAQAKGIAYCFVILRPYSATFDMAGLGGMIGLERWGCPARPGTSLGADQMCWVIAGWRKADLVAAGWPADAIPWFADEREEALGAIAHEIGHLSRAALGHAAWEDDSPMQEWWDGLKRWGRNEFTAAEKAALLASGDFG